MSYLYRLFHFLVGLSYLFAFISIIYQLDGLYGYNGLIPADIYVDRIRDHYSNMIINKKYFDLFLMVPSLSSIFYKELGVTVDAISYSLIVLGLIASSLICLGYYSSILYIICFICYINILSIGQVFLSFQWDTLLMEVGFICIFASPIFYNNDSKTSTKSILNWTFRFLAFKLLFLSGIVKLQSKCPTWSNLTALEYHYATQPLPTPIAYYAHNLPPFVNRLSVAATLIIEISLSLLLLAPSHQVRVIGASVQIFLQALIMITGNYAFFNILTIALMVVVMIPERKNETIFPKSLHFALVAGLIIFSCYFMIKFTAIDGLSWWQGSWITTAVAYKDIENYMLPICLFAVSLTITNIIGTAFLHIWNESLRRTAFYNKIYNITMQLIFLIIAFIIIIMSCRPLRAVADVERYFLSDITKIVNTISPIFENLHVFNGYGLFRSMTGVSEKSNLGEFKDISIVSRPEVIMEGLDEADEWIEIPFQYKPNLRNKPVVFVAPYQPRLDWQMWFLALGSYTHNPWILHLIYKLLQPKPPLEVLELLDWEKYPFRTKAPKAIRCTLWEFDFTRIDTDWNKRIPGIALTSINNTNWWNAGNPVEFIPSLDLENESLKNFLQHHDFPINRKFQSQNQLYQKCLKHKNNSSLIIKYGQSLICSSLLLKKIPKVKEINGLVFYIITFIFIVLAIQLIRNYINNKKSNDIKKSKNTNNQLKVKLT